MTPGGPSSSVEAPSSSPPPPSPVSRSASRRVSGSGGGASGQRSSSPTNSVATSKSGAASPRIVPINHRKSYRRDSSSRQLAAQEAKLVMTSSTSSTSLSRSIQPLPSLDLPVNPSADPSSLATTPLQNNSASAFTFDDGAVPSQQKQGRGGDDGGAGSTILPDPQNPDHRKNLPRPLPPPRCQLLCVFYAEFDIVVGPKVCFQSPQKFMSFDVDVSCEDVHHALDETFQSVLPGEGQAQGQGQGEKQGDAVAGTGGSVNVEDGKQQLNEGGGSLHLHHADSDDYWNWSPTTKRPTVTACDDVTLPSSGHKDDRQSSNLSSSAADGSASGGKTATTRPSHARKQSAMSAADATDESANAATATTAQPSSHSRTPSFASSKDTTAKQTNEGDTSTIDTELLQNSIFAATSEYIITGNELANQTITVSTHGMHILSRPMIICDTKRYERNSLLFAVGFVLRRNVDPRPYWPVLSNLSSTLRDMEVESEFLSHASTRPQIQIVLEDILVSLNSKQRDCHLLLDSANLLNLHLFRPPPPPTPPVPDYAVPILLRPEWQLQMYDWDLTINWIVPHIDGCKYVKQIAVSTEVDMEMVRACLRVLRHHGVLAHVDVFRYSNVYECQNGGLLTEASDKKAEEMKKLLDAAFWYSAKAKYVRRARQTVRSNHGSQRNSPNLTPNSPSSNTARRFYPHMSSLHSLDLSVDNPAVSAEIGRHRTSITEEVDAPRSFPSRKGHLTIREERSMEEDAPETLDHEATKAVDRWSSPHLKEIQMMKKALALLYSSCSRDSSFGDVLLAKIEGNSSEKSGTAEGIEPFIDADDDIDWKLAFDYFDHRRLVTFGVVRGLIRRVHQYPLAYEIAASTPDADDGQESNASKGDDDGLDEFSNMDLSEHYQLAIEMSAIAEEVAVATNIVMDDRSRSTTYSTSPYSASPLLRGMAPPHVTKREDTSPGKLNQKQVHQRAVKMLFERIALAMDGTRCDDELSCMFETPIEKLIAMLQSTGRWNVISVFSCTNGGQ